MHEDGTAPLDAYFSLRADFQLIRSRPAAVRRLRVAHVLAVTTDEPTEEAFLEFGAILQEVEALVNAIEGKV